MKDYRYEGKKVIVTGSNGFVGKSLVQALKNDGAEVIEIDISNGQDITDMKTIKEHDDIDVVFHLAAILFVPYAWENPREVYNVNVMGTLNMLDYCRKNNINNFVLASSYIYGEPEYLPIDEEHPVNPNNPYSRSKFLSENVCNAYHEDYGLNCAILRPFNIYGINQNENFLIPKILSQLDSGKITLKDPNPKRDFVYLADVIDAYLMSGIFDSGFEIFNIGSGKSHSVREVVDIIVEKSGTPIEVTYTGEARKNEVMDVVADIQKAKKMGWSPKVALEDGLYSMIHESH